MATIFQRSNRIYYLVLTLPNGSRRWVSTKTSNRSEAFRMLAEYEVNPKLAHQFPRLSEFTSELMDYVRSNMQSGTARIYKKSFNHFLQFVSDITIDKITVRLIDQFKSERLKHVKGSTVNIELRCLRAGFENALRWDIIESNPFKSIKHCSVDEKRVQFLTPLQYHTLIQTVKEPWLKQMIVLGALTGLRRNELATLTWENIDFQHRLLYLFPKLNFRTKNGKTRIVPLNETALKLLHYCYDNKIGDSVFSFTNGIPVTCEYVSHAFRKYIKKLGFDSGLTFHSLRHTFASWLVQNGASLFEVQKLMGHSSPRVTEIYSHLLPQTLHHVVQLIDPGR